MYEETPKNFLEEIRSLDESIKRRALVIGSAVLMVVVVFVWFAYFNDIVIGGQEQAQANNDSAASAQTETAPAVQTQTANVAATAGPSIWQDIKNGIGGFESFFQSPRQYNIQPQSPSQQ